jgi:hypothetical protein
MKKEKAPEVFFGKEISPLQLTKKCEAIKNKTNIWAFELIQLYQSLESICKEPYQRWSFCKQEKEILISCFNIQEKMLYSMMANIGSHHKFFTDIVLCVLNNMCMHEDECSVAIKRSSA